MTYRGTPIRSIRIADPLWNQVQAKAGQEGLDVSTLIRQLLRGWLDAHELEGEK